MNDAPASQQRAQPHRRLARQHHPEGNVKLRAFQAVRKKERGDDTHGLLRIVAAMAQRIG